LNQSGRALTLPPTEPTYFKIPKPRRHGPPPSLSPRLDAALSTRPQSAQRSLRNITCSI
jgi:hypothetical protein